MSVPLATAAVVLTVLCAYYFGENYAEEPVVNSPFSILYGWTVCLAVLGGMKRWGNRTSQKTEWLSKRATDCICSIIWRSLRRHIFWTATPKLQGGAAYLLSGIAAYAGGYLLYELIKRIPVIRWCVIEREKGENMFKDNLMMLRKMRGMTQEELAEKIDVSRQTLSKYETGESLPDVEKSRLIAEVLDVTLDELGRACRFRRRESMRLEW